MRSEQDIEDERLMNFRYDRNYIGVYRLLILLGIFLIVIGSFSEVNYFVSTNTMVATVTSQTKIGEIRKYNITYIVDDDEYEQVIQTNKEIPGNNIEVRYKKRDPGKIVTQSHLLNFILVVLGAIFLYISLKKYKKEKRIETQEEFKGE